MTMKIKNKKEAKRMLKNLLIISLLSFMISTFSIGIVSAVPTRLYVDPPSSTFSIGETFTVQVKLARVTDLILFEFNLGYDTSILDVVDVSLTPPSAWGSNYLIARNGVNRATGVYSATVAKTRPASSFDGSTSLATITFEVIGEGTSALDLHDTGLLNPLFQDISHDVSDGYHRFSMGQKKGRLNIFDALTEFFRNFFGKFLLVMR